MEDNMLIFGVVVGVVALGVTNYFFPVTVELVIAYVARQIKRVV